MTKKPVSFRKSIANIFTFYAILLVTVALGIAGFAVYVLNYNVQQNEILRGLEKTAQQAALGISSYLNLATNTLEVFGDTGALGGLDREAQSDALNQLLVGQRRLFNELTWLSATGVEQARVSPYRIVPASELASRAGQPEFTVPAGGEIYIGPIQISVQSNVPVTTIGVPVQSSIGELQGVLVAEVILKEMWDVVAGVEFGETGYVYVVDEGGQLRAFSELAEAFGRFGQDVSYIPEVDRFMRGVPWAVDQDHRYVGVIDVEVIGSYAVVGEGVDWGVVVELPTAEAFVGLTRATQSLVVVLVVVGIVAALASPLLLQRLRRDLEQLREGASLFAQGELSHRIVLGREDELGVLAGVLNSMGEQLSSIIVSLEQRVQERTQDLEKRSAYLQASAEVSRAVSSILDTDELIRRIVTVVRSRFDLYYVGLFLVDETRERVVLRAGTGEAGREMLAGRHTLDIGGDSMIGQCVARAEVRLALDVGEAAVRFENPLLPDTRSEMALPLQSRGEVLGALTIQSVEEAAFTEEIIIVLQTLADQLAVALTNAQLFAGAQRALEAERRAYGEITREAWRRLLDTRSSWGYVCEGEDVLPLGRGAALLQPAPESQEVTLSGGDTSPTLGMPIRVRNQTVGMLNFQKAEGAPPWTEEERVLVETLTDQLSVALESARLYEDTQRRAARERVIGTVTSRMRETLDIETVLETAAQEISEALGLLALDVRLDVEEGRLRSQE